MKKTVSLALVLLLLCLPGCTAGKSASGENAYKSIFSLQMKKQKCPSRISLYGEDCFVLDWQENSVRITGDAEVDAIDRAEFTPETNTLRFYLKQSDVLYADYRFDVNDRLCEVTGYRADGSACMQTTLLYKDSGSTVYGGEVLYNADGEVSDNSEFTLLLCAAGNNYVVSALESGMSIPFNEWGDWILSVDGMTYDGDGNLMCVRSTAEDGMESHTFAYSDTDRNYWRSMVLSMLWSVYLGAGGDGSIGSLPIVFQLGYQTAIMRVSNNLYSYSDMPQETTQPFPYHEMYAQILDGENLKDVLEHCGS